MSKRSRSVIRRVLDRVISVAKEELEVTYIVHGRPLSDTISIIGLPAGASKIVEISRKGAERYVPPRPMHEIPPISRIAQPLGLEIWVRFYEVEGIPIYYIEEPVPTELTRKIYVYLKQKLGEIGLQKASDIIATFKELMEDLGVDPNYALMEPEVKAALYYVYRDLLGYGPLDIPMVDVNVEEVSWFAYDGPVEVVDKVVADRYPNSEFVVTNVFIDPTLDETKRKFIMTQVIRAVASKGRVGLTTAKPIAEARIPDPSGRGYHRLAAHLDIVSRSPGITIRKFPHVKYSLTQLIQFNTISPLEAAYAIYQLINRGFILIVGGMASGKSCYKDEFILARIKGSTRLLTLEELWDELARDNEVKKTGNMEVINLDSAEIEVLTVTDTGIEWARPKYIIRHRVKEKLVRIKTKTGRVLRVTKDHSLLKWSVDGWSIRIKPIKPAELDGKTYVPYLRRLNLVKTTAKYSKPLTDPRFGYILGFFVADGSTYNWSFYQKEGETLTKLLSYMNELKVPYTVSTRKARKGTIKQVYLLDWARQYLKLHLKHGNSRTKHIPDLFWNMDEDWRMAFLAGVIDGDGSVHVGKYIIEIATASRDLAYGLLYAFASVGVHAYIREKRIKKRSDRVYYRVFVPISINREPLKRIMKWLTEEKRSKIEEAMEKSSNYHSETDVIPAEIAYIIGTLLKRKEYGKDDRSSWELRSYKYKGENPTYHRVEELVGEKLYDILPRDVGFDEVVEVAEEEYEGYVYDLEVPETENFEANGIFVHNTTLLQALISALPTSYKVVTIEDTPELSTPAQNWHPLYVRRAPRESELEDVSYSRLVIHSLRHRGTIVTLGEVRGAEMADLIQAAASGHGAICLPPDEPVVIRVSGRENVVPIREAVTCVIHGLPVEVLSYDTEKRRYVWKRVRRAIETRTSEWVVIRTEKGRIIKVTPDHRLLLTYFDGENRVVIKEEARNIRLGDRVLIAGRLPHAGEVKRFIVVNDTYVELNKELGYLTGVYLKAGRRHARAVSLPRIKELQDTLERLGASIGFKVTGKKVYSLRGRAALSLFDRLVSLIHERPLTLPRNFVKGVYEALGKGEHILPSNLVAPLHYMLKTIGVDSIIVDKNKLKILGEAQSDVLEELVVAVRREQAMMDEALDFEVEDTHTFLHGSSAITSNCTFHAHDPESVLARITSPPINAAPESLRLISSVFHIARTKTYARGRPETVRRVLKVYEIKEVKGRDIETVIPFSWDTLTDKHSPEPTREGLVNLWLKSPSLQIIGSNLYMDEAPRAVVDVYVIALFLNRLVKEGVFDIKDVMYRMTSFYLRLDYLSDRLWKERGYREFLLRETGWRK